MEANHIPDRQSLRVGLTVQLGTCERRRMMVELEKELGRFPELARSVSET